MPRGYLTDVAGQVGAWYGGALSAEQLAQATVWLDLAEAAIDAATGRPFLTGPVVAERLPTDGPIIRLAQWPIVSVEAVRGYQRGSADATELTAPTDYEVDDAARGRLYLRGWQAWARLAVDYTPAATVPTAIREATAALLAAWLRGQAAASAGGGAVIARREADVEVRYSAPPTAAAASAAELPPVVQQLLAPWRGPRALAFA